MQINSTCKFLRKSLKGKGHFPRRIRSEIYNHNLALKLTGIRKSLSPFVLPPPTPTPSEASIAQIKLFVHPKMCFAYTVNN